MNGSASAESKKLVEAMLHVEQPDNDPQKAEHARLPVEPRSGLGHPPPSE